jgi:hypothetical protein
VAPGFNSVSRVFLTFFSLFLQFGVNLATEGENKGGAAAGSST